MKVDHEDWNYSRRNRVAGSLTMAIGRQFHHSNSMQPTTPAYIIREMDIYEVSASFPNLPAAASLDSESG